MAFLRHYANGAVVGAVELTDTLTIGRAADNTIVLDDGTVSARHANVNKKGDQYVITDANSTNGIFFGGKRVSDHTFADGDVITLGTHEFEFLHELPEEFAKTLKIKKSWIPGIYYTE
ncbi:FHA domain-containing protein [Gilvimarinus sp. F26214L]|uniref:FHA domain-containing protein n=1 Tax=Gilvimarinus sp. DZF01 TaxID=3461371 RepID=UPI004045F555